MPIVTPGPRLYKTRVEKFYKVGLATEIEILAESAAQASELAKTAAEKLFVDRRKNGGWVATWRETSTEIQIYPTFLYPESES